jgi:Cu/Ag efflux pump CusA
VADAVRRSSLNLAGGTIRTREEEIRVRTMGRKYTGKELASIVVLARPEGDVVTLDRLAHIDDGFHRGSHRRHHQRGAGRSFDRLQDPGRRRLG